VAHLSSLRRKAAQVGVLPGAKRALTATPPCTPAGARDYSRIDTS
jgi:hypothetical protein